MAIAQTLKELIAKLDSAIKAHLSTESNAGDISADEGSALAAMLQADIDLVNNAQTRQDPRTQANLALTPAERKAMIDGGHDPDHLSKAQLEALHARNRPVDARGRPYADAQGHYTGQGGYSGSQDPRVGGPQGTQGQYGEQPGTPYPVDSTVRHIGQGGSQGSPGYGNLDSQGRSPGQPGYSGGGDSQGRYTGQGDTRVGGPYPNDQRNQGVDSQGRSPGQPGYSNAGQPGQPGQPTPGNAGSGPDSQGRFPGDAGYTGSAQRSSVTLSAQEDADLRARGYDPPRMTQGDIDQLRAKGRNPARPFLA